MFKAQLSGSFIRHRKAVAVVAAALLLAGSAAASAATATPSLKLALVDEIVVASIKNYPAATGVTITATVPGGSGTGKVTTSSSGRALIGFSVPDGFDGRVTVAAVAGATSKTVNIEVRSSSSSTTTAPVSTSIPPTTTAPKPTLPPATTSTVKPTTTTTSKAPATSGGTTVLGRSFPNAQTTGVPAGVALSAYTGPCTIQTDNIVIDAKIINCDMRILAQNIKITNSVINGPIYSDSDYFNGSFSMTDSEVRMPQSAGTGVGDVNFTLTRVEVTGGSRSVNCAANCTVQDSYLHGQYTDRRGIDHESAIRMGSNSTIRHNHIACDATPVPPDAGCSAALTGYGDFAIVQKNTIDNNLIDGGPDGSVGYCSYGGSTTGKPYSNGVNNIKFTNNIFRRGDGGKCGIWGPVTSFDSNAPGNVWTNNLWDTDGKTVPPAN